MSATTIIQWADGTTNPMMGCGGCELRKSPDAITSLINTALQGVGIVINSRKYYEDIIAGVVAGREVPEHYDTSVTTTNIIRLAGLFGCRLDAEFPDHQDLTQLVKKVIADATPCYAGALHDRRGYHILDINGTRTDSSGQIAKEPRKVNPGYAPTFESLTRFPGRMADAAKLPDLLGQTNPSTPWSDGLARMIFVSDMGDAFTSPADFDFLESEMPTITSENGRRHLWLWLTKRPKNMAKFFDRIGGLPSNVIAMTTLTCADKANRTRLKDIKRVKASMRGLSIEPLRERIPLELLDLDGIDWVIVGGESGNGDDTPTFAIEWAEEIRDHCKAHGVACFVKQLGRMPTRDGKPYRRKHQHGGDWSEWPEDLRVREFPKGFHGYRAEERVASTVLRAVHSSEKEDEAVVSTDNAEALVEFRKLDKVVRKGMQAIRDAGAALAEIREKKLWQVAGHAS